MNTEQLDRIENGHGFLAALDQSGGSTPKALALYGIEEGTYADDEMMDLVHAMRTRIIRSPSFSGSRVLGAILFEDTMDRQIEGLDSAEFLWANKQVVPFLKVDRGLEDESNGVQLMKPIPVLSELLARASGKGVFGTKMRSVIKRADAAGIGAALDQQFEVGVQILSAGLVPILEPEVDIFSPDKAEIEDILKKGVLSRLDELDDDRVMLKLSLPTASDQYAELVEHPNVLRVVALSGGYSRDEANQRLSQCHGLIASFSRALTEGLDVNQSDAEFDETLDRSIESIFQASKG